LFYGSYIAEAFLLSSIISGLIIIFKAINLRKINSFYFVNISKVKTLSLKGTYTIYKERLYWLLASVFSKHVILMDRYIVLFLQEKYFAFYILVCTCLSLVPTIFDIFFLSKNRSRYPKELIPKKEITKDKFLDHLYFLERF
jgi:hypothetical protein